MLEATFTDDKKRVKTKAVWQYDRGVQILVKGLNGLSAATEFHFEAETNKPAIVRTGVYSSADSSVQIAVPAAFLESAESLAKRVWVYLVDGENKMTKALILIPVFKRARPDDYVTQEDLSDKTAIEQAVERYFEEHTVKGLEKTANKIFTVSASSTDEQYPSARAVRIYVGNLMNTKADKAGTLAGYGISNAYTKSEVDAAIQTAVGTIETQLSQV